MNFQFLWRGMTARPARHLKARSSLVRRLVQAHDDPGKQRIRAWLRALDDEQLSNLGLTPEDIAGPASLNLADATAGRRRKPCLKARRRSQVSAGTRPTTAAARTNNTA